MYFNCEAIGRVPKNQSSLVKNERMFIELGSGEIVSGQVRVLIVRTISSSRCKSRRRCWPLACRSWARRQPQMKCLIPRARNVLPLSCRVSFRNSSPSRPAIPVSRFCRRNAQSASTMPICKCFTFGQARTEAGSAATGAAAGFSLGLTGSCPARCVATEATPKASTKPVVDRAGPEAPILNAQLLD